MFYFVVVKRFYRFQRFLSKTNPRNLTLVTKNLLFSSNGRLIMLKIFKFQSLMYKFIDFLKPKKCSITRKLYFKDAKV